MIHLTRKVKNEVSCWLYCCISIVYICTWSIIVESGAQFFGVFRRFFSSVVGNASITAYKTLPGACVLYRVQCNVYCTLLLNTGSSVFVCVFFSSILDIKFVGRTSRGHTGGRSHRIFNPPSFCGACLDFCREKDSAIPFPRRP